MRITRLEIENLRAIKQLSLADLGQMVVIAGPNGCGKSCVFDAIRLLKSVYGGYQRNEWHQWFGEFQLKLNSLHDNIGRLLNDPTRSLRLLGEFLLSDRELNYLREAASTLIEQANWTRVIPELDGLATRGAITATDMRLHRPRVERLTTRMTDQIMAELDNGPSFLAEVTVTPDGQLQPVQCLTLELVFSIYDSQNIGVIEYHGANRDYRREQVSSINLNVDSGKQRQAHALYNSADKYSNIKTEMAAAHIRALIAQQAGVSTEEEVSLIDTLKELFETFFPGKRFLGPQPTASGALEFPVQLENGRTHDINDLSSGEKEVLYGYLRLRNTAPRDSVLLLDEPELHLNPRLIRGLPRFYKKHLGDELRNQIWLVTHSDTFLREAVGEPDFSVYHMQPPQAIAADENQVHPVLIEADVERAVMDLVGDLASYRPGGKVVIFEGGGDSEFDLKMTNTLFPEFQVAVNPISSGNKKRVKALHDLLERAAKEIGEFPFRFYSIVDKDHDDDRDQLSHSERQFQWDVYHIENYLLNAKYICEAILDLNLEDVGLSEEMIESELLSCAQQIVGHLVRDRLQTQINAEFIRCVHINTDPNAASLAPGFINSVQHSMQRIKEAADARLTLTNVSELENNIRTELQAALTDGSWKSVFRGRDVLQRFAGKRGVKYEILRNLIIARMRDDGYQPSGMKNIVDAILEA